MSKTVYIATPYRADTKDQFEKQLAYTKEIAYDEVRKGNDVIVPHLYYPQFLDDDDEMQRNIGLESAKRLILKCDEIVAGTKFGISSGMRAEIYFALENGIPEREVKQGEIMSKNKYLKKCKGIEIDVYDVLDAFEVTDQAIGHAIKKLLAGGQRGYKDVIQDHKEAIASIERSIQIQESKKN